MERGKTVCLYLADFERGDLDAFGCVAVGGPYPEAIDSPVRVYVDTGRVQANDVVQVLEQLARWISERDPVSAVLHGGEPETMDAERLRPVSEDDIPF